MSDDTWTPTDNEVRSMFCMGISDPTNPAPVPAPQAYDGFDRWLAARDATVRADHERAVRERIAQDILAEEPKIRGYVDFDRHREDCIGQINGLRRAARITREGA